MQRRGAGQHTRRVQIQFRARQISECATGLAHNHGQCRNIENIDVRLDHQIDAAAREQMIVQKIAIAAEASAAADQIAKHIPTRVAGQCLDVADRDRGTRAEVRRCRNAYRYTIEKRAT